MRAYRPASWSEQARRMGDRMIGYVNGGSMCLEQVSRFFNMSYRHPRIVYRAAKRFGRALRAGKVKELPVAVESWQDYKAKYAIEETENLLGKYYAY